MHGIDRLWDELTGLIGKSIADRTGCLYRNKVYFVPFLNRELRVNTLSRCVTVAGKAVTSTDNCREHLILAVLSFLVSGERRQAEGSWITEKELPGGSFFFHGPHALPVHPVIEKCGVNAELLVERGVTLGGRRAGYGDGSVDFEVLPGVRMCIALWEADDEFPASCTCMFDRSFRNMLPLDVVLALVHAVVCVLVFDI